MPQIVNQNINKHYNNHNFPVSFLEQIYYMDKFMVFHLTIILFVTFSFPNIVRADKIPGTPYAGSQYYFTTDMTPIEFALWPDLGKKATMPPLAKFSIPRAYVYFVAREAHHQRDPLADFMTAKSVGLMLTYPDGLPYSRAVRDRSKNLRISLGGAARQLRPTSIFSHIYSVQGNAYELPHLSPEPEGLRAKRETFLGNYEGLKRYTTGGIIEIYYAPETSVIRKVRCESSLAKARPSLFCTYYVVLNTHLYSLIRFADFRVNGGLKFAQERTRAFRGMICRYVTCDSVSASENPKK